jgi:hypothetical protein
MIGVMLGPVKSDFRFGESFRFPIAFCTVLLAICNESAPLKACVCFATHDLYREKLVRREFCSRTSVLLGAKNKRIVTLLW